ncbi:radical SAM protein, partial [Verrucomicrobiota bacterium]
SFAGLPCHFIRLAGCNLRCRYCDSTHAYGRGRDMAIDDLVGLCAESPASIVEVTGGEPLLQKNFRRLALALRDGAGKQVLVETNGSLDISRVPEGVVTVMDIKCPGSGEAGSMDGANLGRLRPCDEAKFVLSSRADYEWARDFVRDHGLDSRCRCVLFSPVQGVLDPKSMCEWMLCDRLPVRFQVQWHKLIGIR